VAWLLRWVQSPHAVGQPRTQRALGVGFCTRSGASRAEGWLGAAAKRRTRGRGAKAERLMRVVGVEVCGRLRLFALRWGGGGWAVTG